MAENESLRFACPNCGQRFEVDADMVGVPFVCPSCGHSGEIPGCADEREKPSPPKITVVRRIEKNPGKPKKVLKVVGLTAGVLLALVCLASIVWIASSKGDGKSRKKGAEAAEEAPAGRKPSSRPSASDEDSPRYRGPRKFVKEHVAKYGQFRVCAMTKTGGDVVVCGKNNWASSRCSQDLTDTLQAIGDAGERITDVSLTERGRYIVLYGLNAASWNGIPSEMEHYLRKFHDNYEVLYSAAFNDAGDWIIVASEHFASSASWLNTWIDDGLKQYGKLLAATVTDDAAVAVFERGFKFFGNVPSEMKDELRKAGFDVRIIKISGASWFFADKDGDYYRASM